VASLLVDHFGWVGFEENPITPGRLLGIALVGAGVLLVRWS
jgi:transporter family-2 protein